MAAPGPDVLTLEVPADARYLRVALLTIESLATRAGVDREEVVSLRDAITEALRLRFAATHAMRVSVRYEVGDGFLGVRLLEGSGSTRGTTS